MKLGGRGEFQIIDYLRQQCRAAPGLVRGIGDDCSVVKVPEGDELLTTTDLLAESVHFDLDWTDLMHLGRKAVSVNISDLAAMGARPRYLYLSIALPEDLELGALERFFSGFLAACHEYGAVLAGGDTCRSPAGLTISVTAQGTAPRGKWVGRDGALGGHVLYVTGTLGDSALALRRLKTGDVPDSCLLQRHINPTARLATGLALAEAGIPAAMIDLSDGLLGDLEHILRASAAGAVIEIESIPLSDRFRSDLDNDPDLMELALAGGEDYELLFAASAEHQDAIAAISDRTAVPICRIGTIVSGTGRIRLIGPHGEVPLPARRGYKHFPETT